MIYNNMYEQRDIMLSEEKRYIKTSCIYKIFFKKCRMLVNRGWGLGNMGNREILTKGYKILIKQKEYVFEIYCITW